ncbi:MAG: malonyl-CoA decarboxylase [Paracoccus sp. (in: a-proteobacteria)]|nr:malonyl-CoA decarboxylase [Paracoccus sp. (in: a-proteobacteria)]
MRPIALVNWMTAIADRGRALLDFPPQRTALDPPADSLVAMCHALMGRRGEATGTALAREIASAWWETGPEERRAFFAALAHQFNPDPAQLAEAAAAYAADPSPDAQMVLFELAEPPRQELLRRINQAPGAMAALVSMREALLGLLREDASLAAVDADFQHLFRSWFNRGFLELRSIDWDTPASILEKLIRYEAVHAIDGWDDLRRRLEADRRCFAFFHPALPEEPLVFVEVALTDSVSDNIGDILTAPVVENADQAATTAVFYSISNCQKGLRGVSFGNFLIKQVVDELSRDLPGLRNFVTLSPVPGFLNWLARQAEASDLAALRRDLPEPLTAPALEALRARLMSACASYLLSCREKGVPVDPVARFHLGNGAQLARLNWMGDRSAKGLAQSAGIMVNYAYNLDDIVRNHEALLDEGRIAASGQVHALAEGKFQEGSRS